MATGSGSVLRGAAGAWAAANRRVARLQSQLDVALRQKKEVEAAYSALIGDDEVAARVRCMLPALMAAVAGVEPTWLQRLRRSVGLHSAAPGARAPVAGAGELRSLHHGPRLGTAATASERGARAPRGRRRRRGSGCAHASQPEEVAAARGHVAGTRCTSSAMVFSSLEPLVVEEPCITAQSSRTPMRLGAQPYVPNELQEGEEKLGIGGASAMARRRAVRYAALDGDAAKPDVSGYSLPAGYDGGEERPPLKELDDEPDGGHDEVAIGRKLQSEGMLDIGVASAWTRRRRVGRRGAGRRRVGTRRPQLQPACELRRGGGAAAVRGGGRGGRAPARGGRRAFLHLR
ncbi:unnamed protein product [Prorocentrum cordatum]|uniref:Uncharacterized protein n=1 Tax=Prorocentrum cordatum TaxID=2364126 RepID=A0ABN9VJ23_9DINO|nr:unnamed protein product [Polarella glacialis]